MRRANIPLILVHDHGCTEKIEKLMVEHGIDINREFKSHVDPETSAWVIEQGDDWHMKANDIAPEDYADAIGHHPGCTCKWCKGP